MRSSAGSKRCCEAFDRGLRRVVLRRTRAGWVATVMCGDVAVGQARAATWRDARERARDIRIGDAVGAAWKRRTA
jgi:hypothetical protein